METHCQSIWPQTRLPRLPCPERRWKHWLCKEPELCYHGPLQSHRGLFHQSSCRHRYCSSSRDLFPQGPSKIHWHLDSHGHSWSPDLTFHLWLCCSTSQLPLDLLDLGHGKLDTQHLLCTTNAVQVNGVQFVLYVFLGPETRYIRRGVNHPRSEFKTEYYNFGRIDPAPFKLVEFIQPLFFFKSARVFLSAFAYAMVFLFTSVMITVEIPQLFGAKFEFDAQQLGLQFLGTIIGSVIGEQIGGNVSDYWMNRRARKINNRPAPEYRLWLSYFGYILSIVGTVVFLVQIQDAPPLKWNVSPIIGAGIAAVGNQIITTVLITYCVDCYREEAASVGVFITFVRQTWGFIGPFWYDLLPTLSFE